METLRRITLGAVLLGVAVTAAAQVQTGNIFGVVTDNHGLALPGVLVTLTPQQAQGIEQTTTTNINGIYRFPSLNLGTYQLTFQLEGFTTVVREGIRVSLGSTTNLPVELDLATVTETITVIGEAPIVDTKKTGTAANFGSEMLENIPTARDPWAILEQTPGMTMISQNVGGSRSGLQGGGNAHGSRLQTNTWMVDGVNITDPAAQGTSALYYDFDAYEELQIVTGGHDVSVRSGGVSINFVSKQGTNEFHGEGYLYTTGDEFMSDNVDTELESRGVGENPAGLKRLYDYGFNVGGPILRDRMWFWFGYGVQEPERYSVGFIDESQCSFEEAIFTPEVCPGPTDIIQLENFNLKFNAQISENNKATFLWSHGDKYRSNAGPGAYVTVQSSLLQMGPTPIYKVEDQHIVNDNFFFNAKFAYTRGGFGFYPRDGGDVIPGGGEGLSGVQGYFELGTQVRYFRNAPFLFKGERPQTQFNFDTNTFVDSWANASHEFKAGFEARLISTTSVSTTPGGALGYTLGGEAWLVSVGKDGVIDYGADLYSLYAQDTMVFGKLTLNLGLRFDHQNGYHNPTLSPATVIDGVEFFPANSYAGRDSVITWDNIVPRVGFTYDLGGTGRNPDPWQLRPLY